MDDETAAVPVPGGKPELSWWRVRLNVAREKEAEGAHPVGHDGVDERHVIQMWPASASARRVLVAAPEEEPGAEGEEATEMVDFAGIDLEEPPTALLLHIGDEASAFTGGDAVEVSATATGRVSRSLDGGDRRCPVRRSPTTRNCCPRHTRGSG
ncbi:hypothetical protein AB0I10_34755 [Streptomyces sp. NPDC050636]|uniref:hypothetical protein n=1 Tax=Streptomyces sp. NPDC050636 TaxID=3154510 RepID=UPI0034285D91